MTKSEAIDNLSEFINHWKWCIENNVSWIDTEQVEKDITSFKMAIKALEQEESEDLISKKHLLKTISDLQYNNKNKEQEIGGRDVLNYYIPQIINDEPSAKSSIVHCKDCKKYKRRYFPNGTFYGTVCDWCGFEMKPEDYCSKGERKDADSN